MSRPLLIHVGYPKTASTWLQEALFSCDASGFGLLPMNDVGHQFYSANAFTFSGCAAREALHDLVEGERRAGRVPVLSDEWFAGNQIAGDYRAREVADRLHAAYPEATVLVVIREQVSMVLSSYREYVKCGGGLDVETFVGAGRLREGFAAICRLDHFEYEHCLDYYRGLFGDERVYAVPYEWLVRNRSEFYVELCRRVGLAPGRFEPSAESSNRGRSGASLDVARFLNAWLGAPPLATTEGQWKRSLIQRLSDITERLSPASFDARREAARRARVERLIGDRFRVSNRRTAELLGLDLGSMGYAI